MMTGKLFLHASPVPSYYQLHVPFLIWMSEAYRKGYPVQYEAVCMNREKPVAGNASVFHSMLSLGGIQTDYKEDSLSVASKRYVTRPRYYLNDHNLPKLLDKIGLKEKILNNLNKENDVSMIDGGVSNHKYLYVLTQTINLFILTTSSYKVCLSCLLNFI